MDRKSPELAKLSSIFAISRQRSSSSYRGCLSSEIVRGSDATLVYKMHTPGVRSDVIGVVQRCPKYMNTARIRPRRSSFTYTPAPVKGKVRHHFESRWRQET